MFIMVYRKGLIIAVIALVMLVIFSIIFYQYLLSKNAAKLLLLSSPTPDMTMITPSPSPSVHVEAGGFTAEGTNGAGSFTICLDKCGDSICQKEDTACTPGDFNCTCHETPKECPQDCK